MAEHESVIVRSRVPADVAVLTEILTAVYNRTKYPVDGPSSFPSRFQSKNSLISIVALYNGALAGHAELQDASDMNQAVIGFLRSQGPLSSFAALVTLFVDPRFQGKGIGGQLVKEAMDRGRGEGKRLVLIVLEKDTTAIRMYEKMRWERGIEYFYETKQGENYRAFAYLAPL